MVSKVIAFIGCDKYELILYLARILYHLGKKVLLVDYSENEALYQCIPVPLTLQEGNNYIDYRGIEFAKGQNVIAHDFSDYDVVLMDLGFYIDVKLLAACNKICYVTDMQLHHIKHIKKIEDKCDKQKCLVIKDAFPCKITPEYIMNQVGQGIEKKSVYLFYQDPFDYKYKINSQYNDKFIFPKLSKEVQSFLKDMIMQLDETLSDKQYSLAYKKAERGK
jgi:hypothetical protein